MISLLLALIYLAFISLGLPDPLLGAAWPVMYPELGAELSRAGLVSLVICAGTVTSSLLSERLTKRLGTGLVTALSTALSAAALLGFSRVQSFTGLILWAIPYGLGAGGIDSALNNYVSLHYSTRDMSWLHAFWGVGTMLSPYIMSYALSAQKGWRRGYEWVFLLQLGLALLLFAALPLWRRAGRLFAEKEGTPVQRQAQAKEPLGLSGALRVPGVPFVLLAFFCYCSFESTTGLWAASFLVEGRGLPEELAAAFCSLYFIGITLGRFASGFAANRLGDRRLVRLGETVMLAGCVLLSAGLWWTPAALAGLVISGLGCAPVFPSLIHATPANFGADKSPGIVGVQMASAYVGSALMPPLFGLLAQQLSPRLYPFFLLLLAALLLAMTELLNKKIIALQKEA